MYELNFKNSNELKKFLLELKVDVADANLVASKGIFKSYLIKNVSASSASILKTEAGLKHCELAMPKGAYRLAGSFPAVLFGNISDLNDLQRTLAMQAADDLNNISDNLRELIKLEESTESQLEPVMFGRVGFEWKNPVLASCFDLADFIKKKDQSFDLKKLFQEAKNFVEQGGEMIEICIGSDFKLEQKKRDKFRISAIKKLKKLKVALAARTQNPELASAALDAGANFLSDPEGFSDPRMLKLLLNNKVPVLLGYGGIRNGEEDMLLKVHNFFAEKIKILRAQEFNQIIIELPNDLGLESNLNVFNSLKVPVMLSASTDKKLASKLRDTMNLLQGVNILKTNNIKRELEIFEAYRELRSDN